MNRLFLFIAFLCFIGCSEKELCYECKTTMTTTVSVSVAGYPQTSTTTTTKCGTEEEIADYEREGTLTSSSTVSGISATVRTVTRCTPE